MPGDTFANEHPELSKQSVTSSSVLLSWLCAGFWNNNWQIVTLCCSMQPVQVLQCSNVAFHRVNLLYVERKVNKQAGRQWTRNLVMRDHIRQQSKGMHCSEILPVSKESPYKSPKHSHMLFTHTKCLFNKSSLRKYLGVLLDSIIKHVLLHDARTSM